jgi:hypothetical protein
MGAVLHLALQVVERFEEALKSTYPNIPKVEKN